MHIYLNIYKYAYAYNTAHKHTHAHKVGGNIYVCLFIWVMIYNRLPVCVCVWEGRVFACINRGLSETKTR